MANRGETWDPNVHCIADLRELGSMKLPKMYRDFYNEGAMDLITLRDNEDAFNRYKIRPRILVNVDNVDTSAEIFGRKVSMPLGFSPTAMHRLAHPDGELATSRAAAAFNMCMALSSYSTESLESVSAQGTGNPYVMQVCVLRDRNTTAQLLQRAEAAGYEAIFLSVDVPMLGKRLNEYRNNFNLPEDMEWPNLLSKGKDELLGQTAGGNRSHDYDASLDWSTAIPWLRSQTRLQLWLKGVSCAEDVVLAIEHGLDGVVVSNHGGRQLDSQPASLDALRECAVAAGGKIPVAMDGGIRRGSDLFKALALGATHCFIGRIPIWGLAYNGQAGIELAMRILMQEFRLTMALAGCATVKDISRNHITYLHRDGTLAKL